MTVKVTKDSVAGLLKNIRDLTTREVLVGIPDTTAGRDGDDEEPISNAVIGYIMEFGSPAANIPARPHLIPGVESVEERISQRMQTGAKTALTGNANAVEVTLNAVGLIAQNAVRAKITDGPFEPLAPRTLAARKARGRSGEKPLIDTGQYRRAQTYVIREKGK